MHLPRTRRRLAIALGALVLAAPVLTSCGFDYATDRVYTPASGVNERDADVDVLNAVIVSAAEGSGTFIASFANNNQDESASVESISGAGDSSSLQVDDFEPIQIEAGQLVNLATSEEGIIVKGDFGPGDFVTLSIRFGDGETVEMDVPTVNDCGEYAGLDVSSGSPAGETEPTECGATGSPEQE